MQAASNRTFICSVLFLDIVGYSKKPVAEQIQLKERLNGLLTEALANVAPNDRIILDTGDGAALNFLGDPEDALFVSLTLRDALAVQLEPGPELTLRLGINLGPVKLVKDINGQPNIIGDGINVAQRVMSFAGPAQILVSRSYYEVVSRLSEEYGKLFHYEGSRTDKHVREHEVYAVQATGSALQRAAATAPKGRSASHERAAALDKLSLSTAFVTDSLRRKPRLSTVLAVVAILAIATVLRLNRQPPAEPVAAPSPPAGIAAAPAPAPAKEVAKPPVAEKSQPAAAPVKSAPAAAKPAPPAAKPATVRRPLEEAAPMAPAVINFAITPWGEVYVDGQKRGVAPPLRELQVEPGRHRIEIRNTDFAPYLEVVDAKSGGRIRIRHKFR